MSTEKIRIQANKFRRVFSVLGIPDSGKVDILELLENFLTDQIEGYEFGVVDDAELGMDHGRTYPDRLRLQLSDSTYSGALAGVGQHRFTAAHELGHLLMHRGVANYARGGNPAHEHPIFQDSEWQADTFAAEFLMPYEEVKQTCATPREIETRFGVSASAARIRFKEVFKA